MKKTITLVSSVILGLSLAASAEECEGGACESKKVCATECEKECSAEECEEKITAKFSEFDADKDGNLTLVEFKALAADWQAKKVEMKEVKAEKMEKTATTQLSK